MTVFVDEITDHDNKYHLVFTHLYTAEQRERFIYLKSTIITENEPIFQKKIQFSIPESALKRKLVTWLRSAVPPDHPSRDEIESISYGLPINVENNYSISNRLSSLID